VRSFRSVGGALTAAVFLLAASSVHAGWVKGEFTSGGKPVQEYHCVPKGSGPYPAVVMLHGASDRKDSGNPEYEKMCGELAGLGYYTEFVEYYSQTEAVGPGQPVQMKEDFPVWLEEIHSGLDALDKNPAVDPHRVALMGFSLGSFLSLSVGAVDPEQIAAIVEYYGGLPPTLQDGAKSMPPTLILHGDKDVLVPVAMAHTLDDLLTKEKRPHEMKIYEGANHAFNFPGLAFWYNADDAQDAWNRSVRFLAANLNGASTPAASSK
jgi:carboxymethylenebutenolidase